MARPDYIEVQEAIDALVAAHRKADSGYEYAATTGNLSAILSMLICGEISRSGAFKHLQDTIVRVATENK